MTTSVNLEQVRHTWEEVWNFGRMDILDTLIDGNHVPHHSLNPVLGPEGVKQLVAAFQAAFPDLEFAVQDMVEAGEKVVVRWSMYGTHLDDLMGIPPTGRRVALTGISIYRFADGRTVESWDEVDFLRLLSQISAF